MTPFLLGTLLLLAILGSAWWFSQQKSANASRMVRYILGGGALLAALVLVLRGGVALGVPIGLLGLSMLGIAAGQKRSGASNDGGSRTGGSMPTDGAMSVAQAREILGVGPDADEDTIRQAHRRLMKKIHPDTGEGSAALARQVQAARDRLLEDLGAS